MCNGKTKTLSVKVIVMELWTAEAVFVVVFNFFLSQVLCGVSGIGDLSRFLLSCLGLLDYVLPILLK